MPIDFKPKAGGIDFKPKGSEAWPTYQEEGSTAENPINEQHPELSWANRATTQNLTGGNPEVAKRFLESKGFDVVNLPGFEFAIRRKGVIEPWRKVEKNGPELSDLTDVLGGAFTTTGQILGAGLGAAEGGAEGLATGPAAPVASPALALAKGAAGAFAGGAAAEGILGGLGEMVGVHRTPMEHIGPALEEGAVGAVGELAAPIVAPVVRQTLRPIKGAWELAKKGHAWIDKTTGVTRREAMQKLGDEIAQKSAGLNLGMEQAGAKIPEARIKLGEAVEGRRKAQDVFKKSEVPYTEAQQGIKNEIADKQAYIDEALKNAGSELPRLQTKLNVAVGSRRGIDMELKAAKQAAKQKIESELAAAEERSIEDLQSRLSEQQANRPGAFTMPEAEELKKAGKAYKGRTREPGIKVTTDEAIDAAKTELKDQATGYAKVVEGLGGRGQAEKRIMYGGAEFANPARFATASHLEAHPDLIEAISGFGNQFLPRSGGQKIGSWSIRNRESNLFHLFNERRPVFERGWNKFKAWFGKEAKAAVSELSESSAGNTIREMAREANKRALYEAADRFASGQQIEHELGEQLSDLVMKRLAKKTEQESTIALMAKKLEAAKGLESQVRREINLAKDPLLRTQEAMHPIREEISALRQQLADIKTSRPLTTPEKEALIAAQRVENAAKDELSMATKSRLGAQDASQPLREDLKKMRVQLAELRADRPAIPIPNWVHEITGVRKLPWLLAKEGAKALGVGPKLAFAAQKAQKILKKPTVRRAVTIGTIRSVK